MHFDVSSTTAILAVAAFFAGAIDAIVGGGGLIQVPALFSALPNTVSATVLGTNKLSGMLGTTTAAFNFARRVKPIWYVAGPAAISAFFLSAVGAYVVTYIPTHAVRAALPFILMAVAAYTFYKKDFGSTHSPREASSTTVWLALLTGALIGFYDGVFGPGTGSFLIFIFVRLFGFDFLSASSTSKFVNVATNLAAFCWFAASGHILWVLGGMMAISNIAGSLVGSYLAIKHGSGFVRKLFLLVVTCLIIKTAHDGWF